MHEAFADWYAKADRQPSTERLQHRSDGVEAFTEAANLGHLLDLLRFLSRSGQENASLELLRDTLKNEDSTFLLRDNDVELRVMATVSIIVAIERDSDVSVGTALAVQAVSLLGSRELGPLSKELIETALRYLATQSRRLRTEPKVVELPEWTVPAHRPSRFALPAAEEDSDWWQRSAKALTKQIDLLHAAVKELAVPVAAIAKTQESLVKASYFNTVLSEECSMLWWIFGQHSRDLETPFTSLPPESLSLFFGKDLADLTRVIPGPQSIPALMHKAFTQADVDAGEEIDLGTVVDRAPWDWRSNWLGEATVGALQGIGQCIPAVAASVEIGEGGDWRTLVNQRAGVEPETRLTRLDWARLCHCESLLWREYGRAMTSDGERLAEVVEERT